MHDGRTFPWSNAHRRRQGAGRRQAGFSLVEIIAALAILSFSLAVLTPAIANNIRISAQARDHALARLRVQSLLSELGVVRPFETGVQTGRYEDGQKWSVFMEPYGNDSERAGWPVAAWKITVTVSWDNGA